MNPALILRLLLPEVLAILQTTVKNPQSVASEMAVLTEVRDNLNQIITANTPSK